MNRSQAAEPSTARMRAAAENPVAGAGPVPTQACRLASGLAPAGIVAVVTSSQPSASSRGISTVKPWGGRRQRSSGPTAEGSMPSGTRPKACGSRPMAVADSRSGSPAGGAAAPADSNGPSSGPPGATSIRTSVASANCSSAPNAGPARSPASVEARACRSSSAAGESQRAKSDPRGIIASLPRGSGSPPKCQMPALPWRSACGLAARMSPEQSATSDHARLGSAGSSTAVTTRSMAVESH